MARRRLKPLLCAVGLLALSLAVMSGLPAKASAAVDWQIERVTPVSGSYGAPDVSGNRIVWVDGVGPDREIYTWTPEDGVSRITSDTLADYSPRVSGDRVAWVKHDGNDEELFTWTPLEGTTQLTNDPHIDTSSPSGYSYQLDDSGPQVSPDRIVWKRIDPPGTWGSGFNFDFMVYTWTPDGGIRPMSLDVDGNVHSVPASVPSLSGNHAVWIGGAELQGNREDLVDATGDGPAGVVFAGAHPLPGDLGQLGYSYSTPNRNPAVSGDNIVWVSRVNNFINDNPPSSKSNELYWNGGGGSVQRLTDDYWNDSVLHQLDGSQTLCISGNRIAWARASADGSVVQLVTRVLGQDGEVVLAEMVGNSYLFSGPSVSGDRVVWSMTGEIYSWTPSEGVSQVSGGFTDDQDWHPVVSGDRIAWDRGSADIYTATLAAVPDISVSPASYDFGDVNIGNSASTNITVTNPGKAELDISWSAAGPFSAGTTTSAKVAPGESFTIPVTFAPTQPGQSSASLIITTNVSGKETVEVGLTGTGIPVQENRPPICSAGADQLVTENGAVLLSGYATDPDGDALSYSWDFGDDTTASDTLATTHTYGDNGVFTVALTVSDGRGGTATDMLTVTVGNVAPTLAEIAIVSDTVYVGDVLQVSDRCTDPGSDDETFAWSFGDGQTASATYYSNGISADPYPSPDVKPVDVADTVTHSWAVAGDYMVDLTVSDDDGDQASRSVLVHVIEKPNLPPVVEAGAHQAVAEGDVVTFLGTATDPDGDALTYAWDFGDGTAASGNLTPSHVYGDDGAYTVTLTVSDGRGATTSDTITVTVGNVAPTLSDVAMLTDTIWMGQSLLLSAGSTDPGSDDARFEWDFGDGTTATNTHYNNGTSPDPHPSPDVNPMNAADTVTHSWVKAGDYTVNVKVTDDDGGTASKTVVIRVRSPYVGGGISQPFNADGSSIFKAGSTAPVKVTLSAVDGTPISGATIKIYVARISSGVGGTEFEAVSTSAADFGNIMREVAPGSYVFNLSTKGYAKGTYVLRVEFPDGSSSSVQFSVK